MGILKKEHNNSGLTAAMIGMDEVQAQEELLGGMEQLEIVGPISIYSVMGTDFDQKTFQGLRYLIWDNDKDIALKSADVDADAEDSNVPEDAFVSLTSGLPVSLLGEALVHVEESFSKSPEDFEVSIVEIPSTNSSAIWLRSENSEYFIPYLGPKHLSGEEKTIVDPKFKENIQTILSDLDQKRELFDER